MKKKLVKCRGHTEKPFADHKSPFPHDHSDLTSFSKIKQKLVKSQSGHAEKPFAGH